MRPSRLYIEDFMCYDNAFIDFNEFSSALIVGKAENNNEVSNGVGKTTIFRSIEYALFNYSDVNLENIIRDDADKCSITLDFMV
jgi:DNA repair exonuclease SbcCD ATPase subunit